jgi:hypothetical protein
VLLGTVDGKKREDKRECFKCHQKGHIAMNCPNKKEIKCETCGGNHRTIACWEDERNAHRRPDGWKSKSETTAVQADKAVMLAHIDFEPPHDNSKADKDPSLVIGKFPKVECIDDIGSEDSFALDWENGKYKYIGYDGEMDIYEIEKEKSLKMEQRC